MIIGKLGYIEKMKSDIEQVAKMKRMHTDIIEKMLELRFKSNTLNISTLENMAMTENITIYGNIFPKITLMNLLLPIDRHSLIFLFLNSLPNE